MLSSELNIVNASIAALHLMFEQAEVDESHGLTHALEVLRHTNSAIDAANFHIAPSRLLSMRLAALLHDADDRKYFPETCSTYANAEKIMTDAGAQAYGATVVSDAIKMISLVSCSVNGNSCPTEAQQQPELLWPRWADRLEATGEIGVVRCYHYTTKLGNAITCEDSPRPVNTTQALELATVERFERYQASGGQSASMIDHYYDKLLQIAKPPSEIVRNLYLENEALKRVAPLLSVCMAFSSDGEEGVRKQIDSMCRRLVE